MPRGGGEEEGADSESTQTRPPLQLPDDVVATVLVGEHVLGDEDEGGAVAERHLGAR